MRRPQVKLTAQLEKRLLAYAAAATAAGMGTLANPQAEAKIVYTPKHATMPVNKPYPVDLNHDGTADFVLLFGYHQAPFDKVRVLSFCHDVSFFSFTNSVGYFCSSHAGPDSQNKVVVSATNRGAALRPGAKIQNGDAFGGNSRGFGRGIVMGEVFYTNTRTEVTWIGPWANGGKGVTDRYLGIKFAINGKFHYGWARLTLKTDGTDFTVTLNGYAYETIAGKGIVAGQTEDMNQTQGSLGSLALGGK
jgi:hypothetical protein